MNKQVHRLVFDRRRGMRVPAAEHVRSAGKAAGGQCRARAVSGGTSASSAIASVALMAASMAAPWLVGAGALLTVDEAGAQQRRSLGTSVPRSASVASGRTIRNLPVASTDAALVAGNRGRFQVGLVDKGLQIDQTDSRVIINWDSFDIQRGYTVRFVQPTGGSALNNIWDINPSVILGNLSANGEVILQNQNGVIFGPTARVETGRFVTTALKLASEAFEKGIRNERQGNAVFGGDEQTDQGFISIERGAEIKALAGGEVMMVAPKVYNEGRIETPGGQTILAAGQKVYLYSSTDPAQRGLLVTVDAFADREGAPAGLNTVEQAQAQAYKTVDGQVELADPKDPEAKLNEVVAHKGTINLVGMTVRQNGHLTATTALKGQNGAIYLQAVKETQAVPVGTNGLVQQRVATALGSVELGSDSKTVVAPLTELVKQADGSLGAATQKDAEVFYRSRIDVVGQDVRVRSGAEVTAVSGQIKLLAATRPATSPVIQQAGQFEDTIDDGSRLVVESGAKISAAGLRDVKLPMSRNQLDARLFQIELAGSPVQRNGVIYRKNISFDARRPVTVGDVKGAYNGIGRNVEELSTRGGQVRIEGLGQVVVADGATIDISGGSIQYQAGQVLSSQLVNARGSAFIEDASKDTRYVQLLNPDGSDGTMESQLTVSALPTSAQYAEGADAGALTLSGRQLYLGADIKADVVVGPLQRAGRTAAAWADGNTAYVTANGASLDEQRSAELGRARVLLDQPHLYASLRPMGGTVTIGRFDASPNPISLTQAVQLTPQRDRTVLAVPEFDADGAADFFAGLAGLTQISTQALQAGGVGRVNLLADRIDIALGANGLNLGASATLNAHAKSSITWSGAFKAEGGSVSLTTDGPQADVVMAPSSVIDLSGRQRDERRQSGASDALDPHGGALVVKAGGSADLAGARIDVSGGLWVSPLGGVTEGQAGSISVAVNEATKSNPSAARQGTLSLEGTTLLGHDAKQGGSLSLSGMRTLAIGAMSPGDTRFDDGLVLDAGFFSRGGFGSFALSALGDVHVLAGTQVQARLENKVSRRTRTGDASLTSIATLEDGLRQAVSITLQASLLPDATVADNPFGRGGSLHVEAGAALDLGLGGRLSLAAGRDLTMAGLLRARGGAVNLSLLGERGGASGTNTKDEVGFVEGQAIRLASGSVIDVSGAAKTVTSARGTRTTGEVLAGGSVSLNVPARNSPPSRGLVITEAGSLIDVSGASAQINLSNAARKTTISQGAGEVTVASSEGFRLAGTLKAQRPDDSVGGGSFSASISREGQADGTPGVAYPTPAAGRELLLLADAQAVQSHQAAYGQGVVSAGQLLDAGFDRLALRADDRVVLGSGADLKATAAPGTARVPLRSVVLNTPVLKADDDQAHVVQAAYVALGDRDIRPQTALTSPVTPEATAGQASLAIQAGLIEVSGRSALQGFATTTLDATLSAQHALGQRRDGEIRFIGRTFPNSSSLDSQFNFDRQLTLRAGVVYATTLSKAVVQGQAGNSNLSIEGPVGGSTSATPLSALAQLTLKAGDIVHQGVIHQPFGSISLEATRSTTLSEGSLLSVSGDGVIVPVGSTLNQRQWVYATQGTLNGVDLANDVTVQKLDDLALSKGIQVKGATLSISHQAALQAQAGGDLQAWEFVAGVGGLTDYLDTKDVFAIVPTYHYDFSPHDTEVMATTQAVGTSLSAGDQVQITTPNSVLAAGTYTLLPARYGLLPGAVLVSATQVASASPLKQAIEHDDGSIVVSGVRTGVGSTARGGNDPRLALVIEPAATFRAKSATVVSSINDYQVDQARRQGEAVHNRPVDAGRVSLRADTAFDWAARFNLEGGQLDLAMGDKIAVVADGSAAPEGFAAISADALTNTKARSILLGGQRTDSLEGTLVETLATHVLWGDSVKAGELLAVAKDTITVLDGVTLAATGLPSDDANSLLLKGEGAALAVSGRVGTSLQRRLPAGASAGQGVLDIQGTARLAGAAVQLDATQRVALSQEAAQRLLSRPHDTIAPLQALGIGAPVIALGGASSDTRALSLSGALLAAANSVGRLQLRAYDSIDVQGPLSLGERLADGRPRLAQLVIDTPQVRGRGEPSVDVATLMAQQITLRNTTGKVATDSSQGTGTLKLSAEPGESDVRTGGLSIGEGAVSLAFEQTSLSSRGDIVFEGRSTTAPGAVASPKDSLHATGGLTLSAARITAASAVDHQVRSERVLTVSHEAQSQTLGERRGLGASLSLEGQRVVQDGHIDLASGQINLTGQGQSGTADTVVFTERSLTATKGVVAEAGKTWAVSSPGGHISAQATSGDVVVLGTLDVSAPALASESDTAKSAGSIRLTATGAGAALRLGDQARLLGTAATDTLSGALSVDATQVVRDASATQASASRGTLDRLARLANEGGLHGAFDLRVRQGDQSLDTQLKAVRTSLSVDQGALTLMSGARIDAAAPQGGVVQLAAQGDLVMQAGASIVSDSSRVGANGGDVLLSSTQGTLRLEAGALISARGDDEQDGRIVLRARRDDEAVDAADRVAIAPVGATLAAAETVIEAVRTYEGYERLASGNSTGVTLGQNAVRTHSRTFMAGKDDILAALGLQDQAAVHLRSGVEIRSAGDFEVASDWNLYEANRIGGEPIMLSILAAGNLTLTGSISDGFSSAARGTAPSSTTSIAQAGDAASIRLVAGADASAAHLLKTVNGQGDLTVASGKLVRTTSGSIELAAGRDIEFKRDATASAIQAVAYVAGRANGFENTPPLDEVHSLAQFTSHGGRLEASAGRDITAPGAAQLIGNWFYHTAGVKEDGGASLSNLAWWSTLASFKQGLGSFGGGNVHVQAGRDINNLGVVAPTSARTLVATLPSGEGPSGLVVDNGGDVSIQAGGNVRGGVFMVGRGEGRIEAGGDITVARDSIDTARVPLVGAVLGLMDGHWALQAHGDATMAMVYNPTALASQSAVSDVAGAFFTYGADSGVSVSGTTGQVLWDAGSTLRGVNGGNTYYLANLHNALPPAAERVAFTGAVALNQQLTLVAPPVLRLAALSQDVDVLLPNNRQAFLFPSAQGDLSIYAAGDLRLQAMTRGLTGSASLIMADGDVSRWAGVANPVTGVGVDMAAGFNIRELSSRRDADVLLESTLHQNDTRPARLYAGESIVFSDKVDATGSEQFKLELPKHAELVAGRDIDNADYTGQHFSAQDITLVQAGNNVTAGVGNAGIRLAGPGELQVQAGRHIDLKTSLGIETTGNAGANNSNLALPTQGASIRLAAGADKQVAFDELERLYLAADPQARVDLVMYVKRMLRLGDELIPDLSGTSGAERDTLLAQVYASALQRFKALSQPHQVLFAQGVVDRAFYSRYVAPGQPYAQSWLDKAAAAGVTADARDSAAFRQFKDEVLLSEVTRLGTQAQAITDSTDPRENDRRKAQRDALWAQANDAVSVAGLGAGFSFAGDIDLAGSKVHTSGVGTLDIGGIDLFAPGGQVVVGLSKLTAQDRANASQRGLITYAGGSIRSVSDGDFQVNAQKAFVVGSGDLTIFSARGVIDSGRGSNTDVTVPNPVPVLTPDGVVFQYPAVTTGSGIGILQLSDGAPASARAGLVNLFAPVGGVLALDAFVRNESGGDIRVGGPVKGADNLKGNVTGVAAVTVGGPFINTNSALPADSSTRLEEMAQAGSAKRRDPNAILTVELLGLGDGAVPDAPSASGGAPAKDCPPRTPSCER